MLSFTWDLIYRLVLPKNLRTNLRSIHGLSELKRKVGVDETARHYLLYFLMPLWMLAGLLDWYYHRKTKIEKTAGTHESMIHALMMAEMGLPIIMGLFMEVNALVLVLMIAAFFTHEATAYWDVAYAEGRREVSPNEQHVHSFLEVIPFMVVSFMICMHWDQFLALLRVGSEPARFELRMKRQPLGGPAYIAGIIAAVTGMVVLPHAEELWRCYRNDHTLESHPANRECD